MPDEAPVARQVVLDPHPASAAIARDVVRDLLVGGPLADRMDEAVLLVSEVVTNAVLHAGSEVELSCEITQGTLCVEVRDRSSVLPSVRHFDAEAMTGRGLGMVELIASAWGVEPHSHGKTVWFQLASSSATPADLPGRVSKERRDDAPAMFTVRLRNAPTSLLATTVQFGDTLLREMTLNSIADDAFDGAGSLHGSHIDLGPIIDAVRDAADGGLASVDVDVPLPAGCAPAASQRMSLIQEADALARAGQLLTVAELPEVAACRSWLLGEIISQEAGGEPVAWELPSPLPAPAHPEPLPATARDRLDQLGTAVVVADEANQIIYANTDAGRLLGWDVRQLIGQRLITIVPPDMREAHLAGFGRFLLTREARLLDKRVVVPALRRDGSHVAVSLLITLLDTAEDRTAFLAQLAPADVEPAPALQELKA